MGHRQRQGLKAAVVQDFPEPCSICPNNIAHDRIVRPHGDVDSNVLFLGENPGRGEHSSGVPFIGNAGEEFNYRFLPMLVDGARRRGRKNVMVHNACSCFLPTGESPTAEQAEICAEKHVAALVDRMENLEIVVLMGGTALRLVCPGQSVDLEHGVPRLVNFYGRDVLAFPIVHPAASLHQPKYTRQLIEDFEALARGLAHDDWEFRDDEFKGREDYRLLDGVEVRELNSIPKDRLLSVDTEQLADESPWMLQFSLFPGWARAIMAENGPLLTWFNDFMSGRTLTIHHSKHDLRFMWEMSLDIEAIAKVEDTLIRAYNLGEPQGLKALAYRYCGMRMQEFEEMVYSFYDPAISQWTEDVADLVYNETEDRAYEIVGELIAPKRKRRKDVVKHAVDLMEEHEVEYDLVPARKGKSRPKRWHLQIGDLTRSMDGYLGKHRAGEDATRPKDFVDRVQERLARMPSWVSDLIAEKAAPQPPCGINIVPFETALEYACRDADAGLRVHSELVGKQGRVAGRVVS